MNYIHRHRFRSQVMIEYAEPIAINDQWLLKYEENEQETVRKLTAHPTNAPTVFMKAKTSIKVIDDSGYYMGRICAVYGL